MGFHYTVQSDKSLEEAMEVIEKNLNEIKFSVQWKTNITENLKNKGLTKIQESYNIMEVCSPFAAEKVLSQNPQANYFLPCKIVVYEKDGKTQIGLPKPTELMKPLNDATLIEIVQEIENSLINVIDESK